MLWFSILSLVAAALSDHAEDQRYVQADPLDRSFFDFVREQPELLAAVRDAAEYIGGLPVRPTFQQLAPWLVQRITGSSGARLDDTVSDTAMVVYCLAMAEPYRTIWKLDPAAHEALVQTVTPWDLVSERLPRLPFPAVMVRLPEGQHVDVSTSRMPVRVRSILVVEEVPGVRWRYLGLDDAQDIRRTAYTRGWLDVAAASARTQLVEGQVPGGYRPGGGTLDYRLTGEDAVWQLLINLFLVTEYDHLEGQVVVPRFPRGSEGRRLRKKKSEDRYTVLRLSSGSRQQQDLLAGQAGVQSGRSGIARHLVAGFWRGAWVLDPGDKPVFATKPRQGRDGRPVDGHLYKVATWIPPFWKGMGEGEPEGKYLVRP